MTKGGYREGSGRSKNGYYKGIYCGSTYELCWVIYNIDHKIEFDRFPGKLQKEGVTYYPDFLLSDGKTIVETKGYEKQEAVDRKTKIAESLGYNVRVLRKDDLQYTFDYVTKTYNTKRFYELYDDYKPKYNHKCDYCQTLFKTDRKIKTKIKFCSRSCAGRYQQSKIKTDEIREKISNSLLGKKVKPYKRKYKQVWITNSVINTRIKEGDIIPEGFKQGRTLMSS
jgi:hypothetical protein